MMTGAAVIIPTDGSSWIVTTISTVRGGSLVVVPHVAEKFFRDMGLHFWPCSDRISGYDGNAVVMGLRELLWGKL